MSGCFGNSTEDRYHENQLDNYLNSLDGYPDEFDFTVKLSDSGTVKVMVKVDFENKQAWPKIQDIYWTMVSDAPYSLEEFSKQHQKEITDAMYDECSNFE